MTTIKLGRGLSVPALELATQVVAALGMRGSGKSNLMTVICEGLLAAKIQVIILDYVGIHFGLRLAPDGKTPSAFAIPVIGGPHGDIALASTAGKVVAEALAASASPAVLDVSSFRKGDRVRFAGEFAEAFFDAKKLHPGPCFLVLEEAQRYVPQVMRFNDPGVSRCLGAFEEIAEVGRNYGVGLGLLSQRPQKINKDVLNLAELVFAFQANGVHERKAIAEWVQEKGAEGRDAVTGELPGLRRGQDGTAEAIVWSPSWLKVYGKYTFAMKTTYDAGKTPTHARAAVKTKPLDLEALNASMASVVEQARESDPRLLKAEIARLKKELAAKPATVSAPEIHEVEVGVVPPALIAALSDAETASRQCSDGVNHIVAMLNRMRAEVASRWRAGGQRSPAAKPNGVSRPRPQIIEPVASGSAVGNSGLRRMLTALAQRPRGLTNKQLGVRAGVSSRSGTFSTYLSRARSSGWIDGSGVLKITALGLAALGDYEPLPEGAELADHWVRELGGGAARILQALIGAYPDSLDNNTLGERAGISPRSGTFSTYLSRLRSLELISGRGDLRASEELFS